jgi:cysteinyl-tRNA synthetase
MNIYNSLTRKKEPFQPIHPGKAGIYACGPTVYNYFHIGNARPFITFDVLRRQLEREGYEVTFVQNFTDIDDKMIRRANEEGITVKELADRFIAAYYEDAKALGIRPATVHPKATEHIHEIIELISRLIENGHAYAVPAGDVYYRVSAFPGYGKLSGQSMDEREMGASERLNVETDKENPADFTLWKAQKPGEPSWDSPWGPGRPGWHIECSAMSMKYLGETFDIHCGGKDLLFPHHENEIAQSEGATGKPYVHYWMHNGFINVDNQKMSKSLNNFFTVRDIAKDFDLEAVRLFMLSAHYRSPINFSREQIEAANASLNRLYTARDSLRFKAENGPKSELTEEEKAFVERLAGYEKRFDLK